jgi:two-component system OmpR family sensor kinase
MAAPGVPQKWRPSLALIVLAVLLTVLLLPVGMIVWFRALDRGSSGLGAMEIAAIGVASLITILIALVFSRTITGPINALVERTRAIGRGGKAAIVVPAQQGTREIATLSQSFIDLAERLVDRTEYVSSFAAHVSHELRSPLSAIRGSAELLRDVEMSSEERGRFLDHIIADSDRLTALLDSLRELARADLDAERGYSTLADVVGGDGMMLEGDIDVPMALGPDAARAIFSQLRRNAVEHGATKVTISATSDSSALTIIFRDNGSGVSPGNRDRIFEPFFTTRREDGGTGMGLQIVRSMLAAHGGTIRLLESDSGAAFELVVRLADQAR